MGKVARTVAAVALATLLVSATAAASPAASEARAVVKTAFNAKLKKRIVVDGRGRTLYMFTVDTAGKPMCAKIDPSCPKAWPALTSSGMPVAGKGIVARKLATTAGPGGTRQVVYNRHPLYYFAEDKKPGDVKGQGYLFFWYVLSPAGQPIRK